MSKRLNTRAAAAKLAWQIIDGGQSLDSALKLTFEETNLSPQDRGFVQELVYGVCRWYGNLDATAATLLRSPIRKKDRVVHFVLLVGLYQLRYLETADHAAVAETVSACKQLNKDWAKNLINGCLRNYLRSVTADGPDEDDLAATRLNHPKWIRQRIEQAWPDYADRIFTANNQRPPMCLRVNRRQHQRDEYLAKLDTQGIAAQADAYTADGIILQTPMAVSLLPGFEDGACSVQDTAAQLTADFLLPEYLSADSPPPKKDLNVLDACAAPGGKTAHLLERTDNHATVHALDISERRCEQLLSTLARLELTAEVITADASETSSWNLPEHGYDRILIDAPCSGLGVIRRHPDIKHHRRESDIDSLNATQQALLRALWPTLKPGGLLLYMTCSVLPQENQQQAEQFVASTNDAMLETIAHPNALTLDTGVQTLPGVHSMDGFYYCLLKKNHYSD